MTGLWTDPWFYASAGGLLISGGLFFYLLGRYRAAAEAADLSEPETGDALLEPLSPEPVQEASVQEEPAFVSLAPEKTEEPVSSAPEAAPRGGREDLVEALRGEIHELGRRLDALSAHQETIIERLESLSRAVSALKPSSVPAADGPAPRRTRKAESHPPSLEPAAQKIAELPLETLASVEAQSAPAPVVVQESPKDEPLPKIDDTPRRGPVWPV